MPKRRIDLMPAAADAVTILGQQIRQARQARGWTAADLAARAGVSNPTLLAIENGAPGTAIGTVLNVAAIVGVPLFGITDPVELARMRRRGEDIAALLPSRVYRRGPDMPDDDF